MYLDDITPMLAALSRVAAEGATLSLLVRNGLATAMRDGLRGHAEEALSAFDRRDYINRLGLAAHAHTPEDLNQVLVPSAGTPSRGMACGCSAITATKTHRRLRSWGRCWRLNAKPDVAIRTGRWPQCCT